MVNLIVEDGSGVANSNSYISLADAKSLLATRPYTDDWDAAADDAKSKALIGATAILDSMVMWRGTRVSVSQSLQWPRVPDAGGRFYRRSSQEDAGYFESNQVPKPIREATAELAMFVLSGDLISGTGSAGINGVAVGPIKVDFSQSDAGKAPILPEYISRKVAPFARSTGGGGMLNLIRA